MAAVLVHIDLDGDRPHPASLVALAAGREVASSWGGALYAAAVVDDAPSGLDPGSTAQLASAAQVRGADAIRTALARAGADKVVIALVDRPVAPLWAIVGAAWQAVLDQLRPRLVLFGADSPSAIELAPRTGARIGARLLPRARVTSGELVELRDRDGAYVRVADAGAAVALVGTCEVGAAAANSPDDVDVAAIVVPGAPDPRVELAGNTPAELAHAAGAIVALGDDVATDPELVADARRLADALGATLVGGPDAVRAGAVAPFAIVDRATPLAPELCVAIGDVHLDLAGATSVVRIGGAATRPLDGVLAGPVAPALAELARRLERA